MPRPTTILLDIEGTTTPISFVHRTLFPYARTVLPDLVAHRAGEREIDAALAEIDRLAPGSDPVAQLLAWMDDDAKITPLKTLQGIAWRDGYATGQLTGALYPDVAPALARWHAAGLRLAIYSSGSEEAQRLIFAHTATGDLTPLLDAFFDTRIGTKRDPASYVALARRLDVEPAAILFLSDVAAELDAAAAAGLRTCQLARPDDGTVPTDRHPVAADLDQVASLFALPGAGATPTS